jgi:hypothetical protein
MKISNSFLCYRKIKTKNTKNEKTQSKLKTESQMNLWGYLKKLVVSHREEKSGNELRNNQVE